MDKYEFKNLSFYNYTVQKQENKTISPCDNCSNNPKNGGSGICFCTLGLQDTYW